MPKIQRLIFAILGLVVSLAGFTALMVTNPMPPSTEKLTKIGVICAIFSCMYLAAICGTICFAYVAEKKKWRRKIFTRAAYICTSLSLGWIAFALGLGFSTHMIEGALLPQTFALAINTYAQRLPQSSIS